MIIQVMKDTFDGNNFQMNRISTSFWQFQSMNCEETGQQTYVCDTQYAWTWQMTRRPSPLTSKFYSDPVWSFYIYTMLRKHVHICTVIELQLYMWPGDIDV